MPGKLKEVLLAPSTKKAILDAEILKHFRTISQDSSQKYLFDHYLHFLKLHIINNYIYFLFIWSRRLPLIPHLVAGMGATFMEKKIHVY